MDRRSFVRRSLEAGVTAAWLGAACRGRPADARTPGAPEEEGSPSPGETRPGRDEPEPDRRGRGPSASTLEAVGLQLYTVRSLMAESVERTLRTVASIGYREVELAGAFGHPPDELRALLDELGLSAPSAHHPLERFRDGLDELLETGRTLGHRYLVLPWIPEGERSLAGYRRLAAEMNRIGEACRSAGIRFAYHNHAFEFEPVGGVVPFDLLLAETDPELVRFELDLFWLVEGGGDPLARFEAHPGRFELWHVKDRTADGRMVDVGAGSIDFAAIFGEARRAGLEHFFVEHDAPADPVASVRASYRHLAGLEP